MLGMLQTMVQPDTVIHSLGPIIWIDPRYIRGAHGDLIVTATDKSGNGYDFVQGTSSKMPMMNQQITKVPAALSFDGINDSMGTSKTVADATTRFHTLFMMTYFTGTAIFSSYEVSVNQNNYTNAWGHFINENGVGSLSVGGQGNPFFNYNGRNISGSLNQWWPYAMSFNRLAADTFDWNNVIKLYMTGTQITNYVGALLNATASAAFGNHNHYLFGRNNASLIAGGYLSHLCFFNKILTADQINALDSAVRDINGRVR